MKIPYFGIELVPFWLASKGRPKGEPKIILAVPPKQKHPLPKCGLVVRPWVDARQETLSSMQSYEDGAFVVSRLVGFVHLQEESVQRMNLFAHPLFKVANTTGESCTLGPCNGLNNTLDLQSKQTHGTPKRRSSSQQEIRWQTGSGGSCQPAVCSLSRTFACTGRALEFVSKSGDIEAPPVCLQKHGTYHIFRGTRRVLSSGEAPDVGLGLHSSRFGSS